MSSKAVDYSYDMKEDIEDDFIKTLLEIDLPLKLDDYSQNILSDYDLLKEFEIECLPSNNEKKNDTIKKSSFKILKDNSNKSKVTNDKYRDFSQISDEEALKEVGINPEEKSIPETFPIKLHKIIERSEIDGYSDIISWLPHGRAFRIYNPNAFVTKVMSRYFYISKFTSFIRQLSIYGFRKVSRKGIDKAAYYHDMFLCGRQTLSRGILRLKTRPTLKSKFEPNFYIMPPLVRIPTLEDIKRGYMNENAPKKPRVIQYHREVSIDSFLENNMSLKKVQSEKDLTLVNDFSPVYSEAFEYKQESYPDPLETYASMLLEPTNEIPIEYSHKCDISYEENQSSILINNQLVSMGDKMIEKDLPFFSAYHRVAGSTIGNVGNFCYSSAA